MVNQNQKLNLNIKQNINLSQQLQKSLELLQLTSMELMNYITQECEQNPLLQLEEDNSFNEETETESTKKDPERTMDNNTDKIDETFKNNSALEEFDYINDQNYMENNYIPTYSNSNDSDLNYLENLSAEKSLREFIEDQIHSNILDYKQQILSLYLLNMLDDDGYLRCNLIEVGNNLNCSLEEIEMVLEQLQKFDPVGIFARDIKESIKLQLIDRNHFDIEAEKVIEHLDLIAKADYKKIHILTGISIEDIEDICQEIKTLNPTPANNFAKEHIETLTPDVFVKKNENNEWVVEINYENLPKVLINNKYYNIIKERTKDKSEKTYLTQQMHHANWLIKSLDQRAKTIVNVATKIVEKQQEFFDKGLNYLKPMNLNDIAEELSIHESTVSRVTVNKYMATPKGMFEMKYFFPKKISGINNNEDMANTTIQQMIKTLIEHEANDAPLSDEEVVILLKNKNINIARRTVAKYRSILKIPSSVMRKRQKR